MILVDTGPLVALFDVRDRDHGRARSALASLREPMMTTVPVLTEAFHLIDPASKGAAALAEMIRRAGLGVHDLDTPALHRALELMDRWRDRPMDLADASIVVTAEHTKCLRVLTLDRGDFATYRARIGRSWRAFTVIDVGR